MCVWLSGCAQLAQPCNFSITLREVVLMGGDVHTGMPLFILIEAVQSGSRNPYTNTIGGATVRLTPPAMTRRGLPPPRTPQRWGAPPPVQPSLSPWVHGRRWSRSPDQAGWCEGSWLLRSQESTHRSQVGLRQQRLSCTHGDPGGCRGCGSPPASWRGGVAVAPPKTISVGRFLLPIFPLRARFCHKIFAVCQRQEGNFFNQKGFFVGRMELNKACGDRDGSQV